MQDLFIFRREVFKINVYNITYCFSSSKTNKRMMLQYVLLKMHLSSFLIIILIKYCINQQICYKVMKHEIEHSSIYTHNTHRYSYQCMNTPYGKSIFSTIFYGITFSVNQFHTINQVLHDGKDRHTELILTWYF